jgi:hypothetical protein
MACNLNQDSVMNADLTVNGEKIALNSFVEGFMSQTVIGMIKSLRGVDKIETINLKISKKEKRS